MVGKSFLLMIPHGWYMYQFVGFLVLKRMDEKITK